MSSRNDGRFIGHAPHTEGEKACGSSDGLALYEKPDGKIDGYCWVCEKYVSNDVTEKAKRSHLFVRSKSPEEIAAQLYAIWKDMPTKPLVDRGIRQEIAAHFGVKVAVDQADGITPIEHYYPYISKESRALSAYKVRRVKDKGFYSIGSMKDIMLFGQMQAESSGSKKIFITEGECDAMALYQALIDKQRGTQWEDLRPAVVSISRGASKEDGATKVINELGQHIAFFNRFEEIIFVFDQDVAGENSAKEASKLFPGKAKIAKLAMKDANDMLLAGKGSDLAKAVLFQAQAHKPSSIVAVGDVFERARQKATWGIEYPWKELTRLTYGIRAELIGVGAGVGCGKTTFWHVLESWLMNKGFKIGSFMLEEPNSKTLKMIAGQQTGIEFHNPEAAYTQEQLDSALKNLEGKILMYSHNEDRTWDSIKQAIRHMVLVEDVKFIFLDPISAMTYHLNSSETNDELNMIFGELAGMVEALQFTCFFSSHLNEPKTGDTHEEGGRVKSAQFTGSRAMQKWSHYIIGLERNTQAEDEIIRNTMTVRVLKDREYGNTGNFQLFYDRNSGTLIEPSYDKPEGVNY